MFNDMENLKLIDILRRPASIYREFKSRPSHGFVFKISGESTYNFENTELIHSSGELLFIPKGEKYHLRCQCETSEYLLINFDADIKDAEVKKFNITNYPELDFLYDNLEKLWLFGETSGKFKCISAFFDVVSFINLKQNSDYASKRSFSKISTAVKYLENHIFDSNLKAGKLSEMCNMSDTHFRKIFKAHYGLTPSEYIITKRLSRARAIIASGDYETIYEVAHHTGFDDALYFSKIFKARYKTSPSMYTDID